MKGVKYIFFDWDHTLWDHEKNATNTLKSLYSAFLSQNGDLELSGFLNTYHEVNAFLWEEYNFDRVSKSYLRDHRFRLVLEKCGIDNEVLASEISEQFMYRCPRQKVLMEGADVALNYLIQKYRLSIVTNGFEDVQQIKIKASGLDRYFDHVFTSETTGKKKPDPGIFEYALKTVGAKPKEVVMVGDNVVADIQGAQNVGICPIFFNPSGAVKSECQWQIGHLEELLKIL